MSFITSNELNYIVFRYLQESGFTHSAFALGFEAGINKSPIDGQQIPPAALVKLVQKGIQYIEMEANICNGDVDGEVDEDFTFVEPWDLMTKSVDELRRIVEDKKRISKKDQDKERSKDKELAQDNVLDIGCDKERGIQDTKKKREVDKEKIETDKVQMKDKERKKQFEEPMELEVKREHEDIMNIDESGGGAEPMDIHASSPSILEVLNSDVVILEGHTSEVFACSWSPTGSLLASGSGDSTARIWTIPCGNKRGGAPSSCVLKHFQGKTNEKSKDVTTLDWNGEGTLLATGSYDGNARIWSRDGDLKNTLSKHKGPIFSLKWNKKGDFLLSGSVDKTAIVWDMKTGECRQQFEFHSAPTLDVDWRNNVSFATCSTDSKIYVCKIGENQPIKIFHGHQGEINAIKWDPTGSLLASCSDDETAKIWSLKQDTCVHDFREHNKEIYTIRWSPTGPGTCNSNKQLVLASASFDSTIKLWDVEIGRRLHSLNGHRQPVYSVAFSPNGDYLASGSLDNCLHIWSVKEGKIVKTYTGAGGIFEVSWNREGDKIAACFSNSTVCVVDFRM